MNILILTLTFLVTTLAGVSIVYMVMRRRLMRDRLEEVLQGSLADSINEVGSRAYEASLTTLIVKWFEGVFKRQGKLIQPEDQWEKSYLKAKLVTAGFRREEAQAIFQGMKLILAVLLPTSYLLSLLMTGAPTTVRVIVISLVLAAMGFYLPGLYLKFRTKKRQHKIAKALPNALDMMVICVEAGLGLDAAVQRVGDEMELASPELGEELQLTSLELRAGKSRTEAFKNIGNRTGVDEVKALAALLVQTDRFGTSVANALRVHADGTRVKRRQRLEEEAAKTSVKLIFPLIFFIFPSIMVVMVGPAIMQIATVLLPAMRKSSGM
jgi:tight adherence protein C